MKTLGQKPAGRLLALRSVGSAAPEQGQGQGQEELAPDLDQGFLAARQTWVQIEQHLSVWVMIYRRKQPS